MSSDKFHCTNGLCLTDCVLSSVDYDRSFPPGFCPHSGIAVYWKKCGTTEKKPTVFDTITVSPEVLAPRFIYTVCTSDGEQRWCSALLEVGSWFSESEAIAATVAKLKEVCNE